VRWLAGSVLVAAVLWSPPVIDQLTADHGNLGILARHFGSPPEEAIGLREGGGLVLERLDAGHLVVDQLDEPGGLVRLVSHGPSRVRGAAVLLSWLAAAGATAWRLRRHRTLVALHAVIATALVLALVVVSRIFGTVWYYLMLWVWALPLLMVVATGWTVAKLRPRAAARAGTGVLAALAVVALLAVARHVDAARAPVHSDAELVSVLAELVEPTVDALDRGVGDAVPGSGTYLVTWDDSISLGAQGYGLLDELERRGFDVGVLDGYGVTATRHRVLDPSRATARVVLATGASVDRWRTSHEAVEVAYVDPRTPEERAEYDALRAKVVADLRAAGLDELVAQLDANRFMLSLHPSVSADTRLRLARLGQLGVPTAVFVAPSGAELP
jgi:hypothetical protein